MLFKYIYILFTIETILSSLNRYYYVFTKLSVKCPIFRKHFGKALSIINYLLYAFKLLVTHL